MSKNKLAIPRLMHLVAMLKENRYPNHPRLVAEMRKLDVAGVYNITQKTVQRDVNFLKTDYHAPIAYDFSHKGYYLLDPEWNFDIPSLPDSEMEASALGARLAEELLPNPVGSSMRRAMDQLLAACGAVSDNARTSLLALVATGPRVPIAPEIFSEVFKAWQTRHLLRMSYWSAKDRFPAELLVEPHVLIFHDGFWYLKVHLRNSDRKRIEPKTGITLAVHRIREVSALNATFETDRNILDGISHGRIFDFPMVKDVVVKLTGMSVTYGREAFKDAPCDPEEDGSVTVHIPEIEEYRIVGFVLTNRGRAEVLEPRELVDKIAELSAEILKKHKKD